MLKAKAGVEDACVGAPKDVPGVLNVDAGVPNNGAGPEPGCVGVPKEGVPKEDPGVEPGWEATPNDRPLVEDEDAGVAKEKPEVEAEEEVGVPKDEVGFVAAGLLKDGIAAEDAVLPNEKPADDAWVLKGKEDGVEVEAGVPKG